MSSTTAAHEELTLGSGFDEIRDAAKAALEISRSLCRRFLEPEFFSLETIERP